MTALNALWRSLGWPGKEHLYMVQRDDGWVADGLVMASLAAEPFRFHYRIYLDGDCNVQRVVTSQPFFELAEERLAECHLCRDDEGQWSAKGFTDVDDLNGCIDVDITISAFTNTLPIRRLKLPVGESADIDVAWIHVPELTVQRARQRYTHLEHADDYHHYRFEGLDSGFCADIVVDAEGLVVDYPDLFTRL